jgi:hypothetical protein
MNSFLKTSGVCGAALLAATLAWPSGQTTTAVSAPLQQKIDALLKPRLKPEPLPVNPPNPFQMIGGMKREAASEEPARSAAMRDDVVASLAPAADGASKEVIASQQSEILITCATRLKLGGVIILKDQIQIVVNGVPRREGDTVAADWNNTIVYLKIVRLLPGTMVLRYGESEATVKF